VGQITNPIVKGITVNPVDRQSGPGAGGGAIGNTAVFLGANAGQNSAVNNLVIIGNNSGAGGINDAVNLPGTTIVGAQSGQALTGATANTADGAVTILGSSTLKVATFADSSVIIGQNILPLSVDQAAKISQDVLIGNGIATDPVNTGPSASVIIGYHAQNITNNNSSTNNVIIGASAMSVSLGSCNDNVCIGFQVMGTAQVFGPAQNVVIGSGANVGISATSGNVVLGFGASAPGASALGGNVAIGAGAVGAVGTDAVNNNVVIGVNARVAPGETTGNNVIIGANAGRTLAGAVNSVFIVETNANGLGAQKCLVFGQFATGNMIFGNSVTGASQDFGGVPGTNMLKLVNGTKATGANVSGGGYFYVLAGVLHWVDSNGVDFGISDPAAPATGASTASFVATNKPGATTGLGPVAWENKVIQGVSYQSPLWAT
jgi:hypothetical protein